MLERVVLLISACSGALATVAVPIVLAILKQREPKKLEDALTPTFGMTVDTAIERGDRALADLVAELRDRASDAEKDSETYRTRLEEANRALAAAGLPLH